MVRDWAAGNRACPARLLYSSRTLGDAIYRHELAEHADHDGVDVQLTLTRDWPEDWQGPRGRIDQRFLDEFVWPPERSPHVYVRGPTTFVEAVAEALVRGGHEPKRIKTERFGPTGT